MRYALTFAVVLGVACLALPLRAQDPFPHDRHAKLFPNCEACHGGVITGRADRVLPNPKQCESCHNGTDAKRVQWTPRLRGAQGLLRFSHVEHATKTDSAGRGCENCHAETGAPRMTVLAARSARCFACHTHRTTAHYDETNRCATCHVPLTAATALSVTRVAQLPRPANHEDAAFIATHGTRVDGRAPSMTSCATCHARESCVRCHFNARTIPAITALGKDSRVAAAVRDKRASYPQPVSHTTADFVVTHGPEAAREPTRCASCHAQPSCRTCHTGTGGRKAIDALPSEPTEAGVGRGVQLQRASLTPGAHPTAGPWTQPAVGASVVARTDTGTRRVRVHAAGFERVHANAARSATLTCEGCHSQSMCASCHTGERTRTFHAANFAMRHAATAYSRETDCASCHNTETFCRSCHRTTGVGARGNGAVLYHNAESQWLLQHGRAARQNLTTCTSCHQQRDCMQCHSTLGWGVNPHGPGFDAARLWKQAKTMCLRCHLSDPTR